MRNRSIGLFLDHIIDRDDIGTILNEIKICSDMTGGKFMLILFNQNLSENKLKSFTKKHSDVLFNVHTKFTQKKTFRVGFFIDIIDCGIENYRYRYKGDIYKGINEYKHLLKHISRREGIGNEYRNSRFKKMGR
tara:strand:- start:651 stop:1052 length:402 start_codon:yes stop_codon:yes gene_type:complete